MFRNLEIPTLSLILSDVSEVNYFKSLQLIIFSWLYVPTGSSPNLKLIVLLMIMWPICSK